MWLLSVREVHVYKRKIFAGDGRAWAFYLIGGEIQRMKLPTFSMFRRGSLLVEGVERPIAANFCK